MQDEFHWIGSTIFSQEHRRLVCIEDERRCSGRVLLSGAVKLFDDRSIAPARVPDIAGSELNFRQPRLILDGIDCG
jgi:hypothetical protein